MRMFLRVSQKTMFGTISLCKRIKCTLLTIFASAIAFFILGCSGGSGGSGSNGATPPIPNSASAPAQMYVINTSPMDNRYLNSIETYMNDQVPDLTASWGIYYAIRSGITDFDNTHQPVRIIPGPLDNGSSTNIFGLHGDSQVLVSYSRCAQNETDPERIAAIVCQVISREVMEEVLGKNICAPCDGLSYDPISQTLDGWVADFVLPAWYTLGSNGPWDWSHHLQGPGYDNAGLFILNSPSDTP